MKNGFRIISSLGALMLMLCLSFNSFAGWDYKSEVSLDRMEGRLYIVTHCEDKLGDDCNMPGSASRTDISIIEKLIGVIRV
ncbi:hypothetical protein ACV07N_04045 [Roseivirga echinicomitans]